MLLAFRIIAAILFSSFIAWSQTNRDVQSWQMPVLEFPKQAGAPEQSTQFTFKLNLPDQYLDKEEFNSALAVNLPAPLYPRAASSGVPSPAPKPFGYMTRHKIHKYASIATLPLAVSEIIVGEKLDDSSDNDSLSTAHSALAAGIGVLFGVESVTGVWNLWTTRKNPGHGKRMFHGILMLAADAGFVATAALAPGDDDGGIRKDSSSAHRSAAYASLGVAAASYIYMLFAK